MNTIHGIIQKTINNTEIQLDRLNYQSTNVANLNTNAHKNVRFEQILDENGYLDGVIRRDFSVGTMYKTQRQLDVAINGYGFIPVTTETGEIAYTRDGSFKIGKDGYLFNMRGDMIGDGIQIPVNAHRIDITPEGKINVTMKVNGKTETIGTIPLVYFKNPEGLEEIGGNKFAATEESGEPILEKDHQFFKQGYVESSNTDLYDTIAENMRVTTSILASYEVVKAVDRIYQQGINLTE